MPHNCFHEVTPEKESKKSDLFFFENTFLGQLFLMFIMSENIMYGCCRMAGMESCMFVPSWRLLWHYTLVLEFFVLPSCQVRLPHLDVLSSPSEEPIKGQLPQAATPLDARVQ